MTLSSEVVRLSYAGDGATTVFPITFVFWDTDDILAVLRSALGTETTWAEGTHYTIAGGDGDTGTLTALTAPASGTALIITSNRPLTQEHDFPLGGSLPSTSIERSDDQIVRLVQQMDRDVDRALKFPLTDALSISTAIPSASNRASKYLTFDAFGNVTVSSGDTAVSSTAGATPEDFGGSGAHIDDIAASAADDSGALLALLTSGRMISQARSDWAYKIGAASAISLTSAQAQNIRMLSHLQIYFEGPGFGIEINDDALGTAEALAGNYAEGDNVITVADSSVYTAGQGFKIYSTRVFDMHRTQSRLGEVGKVKRIIDGTHIEVTPLLNPVGCLLYTSPSPRDA